MQVAENGVAPPHSNQAGGVRDESCEEEYHGATRLEGSGANVVPCETNGSAGGADNGTDGVDGFFTLDDVLEPLVVGTRKGDITGTYVELKSQGGLVNYLHAKEFDNSFHFFHEYLHLKFGRVCYGSPKEYCAEYFP